VYNDLSGVNKWREEEAQDIEEQQQDIDDGECSIV